MKKIYLFLLAVSFNVSAMAQDVLPKLSPVTKAYLQDAAKQSSNNSIPQGYVYKKRNDGKICVSAIIKISSTEAAKVQEGLDKLNATVGTKAGSIWTVQIPLENVVSFTTIKGISYIQLDEPVIPQLDVARKTTRVDSVQGGISLPMGYSGKGVLVGIMDFGFDYNHPTLYDTSGNKYRIIKSWEMNGTGTAPAGFSYGNEISDTLSLKAKGTDNKDQTHGTGVAGLAAGSGYGSPSVGRFRGMAYESELIFVGVRRDSIGNQWLTGGFSDFIDGVSYMMKYAKSVGKPIVVNISWGSHSGPHDGTSLVNQAFDTLSGKGKIIVMSGGNDGSTNIHLNKSFTAIDTSVTTFLQFSSPAYKRTWIDVWGDTAKTFCVKTTLYSKGIAGNSTGKICIDNSTKTHTLISANGLDTCFVQTYTSSAEYNMKPRVTINVYSKTTDSIGINATGNNGNIHMWNEYYYYGYTYKYNCTFTNLFSWGTLGNTNTTISDMGAGKSTLLIGAYTSKSDFTDVNGIPRSYRASVGYITPFSSKGPYVDGRIRPDITAPGLTIATSVNSWDTAYTETGTSSSNVVSKFTHPVSGKKYYFGEFAGTSASAPIASGIIALLLQIDPTLSPDRVRTILYQTAIQDTYTGTLPAAGSVYWGQGKINAYGAVRKLLKDLSVGNFVGTNELDCVLYPNPSHGIFNLDYNGSKREELKVQVLDMTGKTIMNQSWQTNSGSNILPLDLSSFSNGIYIVSVQSNKGNITLKATLQ
ncbi:MAG: S8/S53 family peptidase [Phycisphaerales bacterium]|nr:S8/S53 family peptidase [Phycisphaerales bacterium]